MEHFVEGFTALQTGVVAGAQYLFETATRLSKSNIDASVIESELNTIGEKLITWANPNVDVSQRPTQDWPVARFSEAFTLVAAYLVFTIVVSTLFKLVFGSEEKPEAEKRSVLQKFKDEPIVILQALYNPAQVHFIFCTNF
jgi:hypothetical protein